MPSSIDPLRLPYPTADHHIANKQYVDDGVTGDGTVLKVIKVTQVEYDALTPVDTTLYVIDG